MGEAQVQRVHGVLLEKYQEYLAIVEKRKWKKKRTMSGLLVVPQRIEPVQIKSFKFWNNPATPSYEKYEIVCDVVSKV